MANADEPSWLGKIGQGYGALVAVLLAVVGAAIFLPTLNAVTDAPAVVTEADIARLRSLPAVPGSAESEHPVFARAPRSGRGMSPCTRDRAIYGFAQFVLPTSQLRRLEYSLVTDCRLRAG